MISHYYNHFLNNLSRHCQEMLTLIGEKDREVDRMCLFDHSMKPPAEPPEGKKSSLYKTPAVFESLDLRAIDVSLCHLED